MATDPWFEQWYNPASNTGNTGVAGGYNPQGAAGGGSQIASDQAITDAYLRYLVRAPSEAELQQWRGNGNFEEEIRNSPEALQAEQTQNAQFPGMGYSRAPVGQPGAPMGSPTQDWNQQSFSQQFGTPGTPQELLALESRLNQSGIKVLKNAAGVAGKIQLPNGQIIDIINSAGAGGNGFQWLTGDGGSGSAGSMGGAGGMGIAPGQFVAPYGQQFSLPSLDQLQHMPGYKAGLKAGFKGIESSAAAKGTLLTGGTMKELANYGIGYANQQYGNLAGLSMGVQDRNYNLFKEEQDRPFDKYYKLSDLGLRGSIV